MTYKLKMYSNANCENYEKYEDEAILVYRIYIITGGISSLITFSLFIIYQCNKNLRMHPNGITSHLLFSLCIFSLTYFANGLTFYIKYFS